MSSRFPSPTRFVFRSVVATLGLAVASFSETRGWWKGPVPDWVQPVQESGLDVPRSPDARAGWVRNVQIRVGKDRNDEFHRMEMVFDPMAVDPNQKLEISWESDERRELVFHGLRKKSGKGPWTAVAPNKFRFVERDRIRWSGRPIMVPFRKLEFGFGGLSKGDRIEFSYTWKGLPREPWKGVSGVAELVAVEGSSSFALIWDRPGDPQAWDGGRFQDRSWRKIRGGRSVATWDRTECVTRETGSYETRRLRWSTFRSWPEVSRSIWTASLAGPAPDPRRDAKVAEIADPSSDPDVQILSLIRFVRDSIRQDRSVGWSGTSGDMAASMFRSRTADKLGKAVLLARMLRSRGIPARVKMGVEENREARDHTAPTSDDLDLALVEFEARGRSWIADPSTDDHARTLAGLWPPRVDSLMELDSLGKDWEFVSPGGFGPPDFEETETIHSDSGFRSGTPMELETVYRGRSMESPRIGVEKAGIYLRDAFRSWPKEGRPNHSNYEAVDKPASTYDDRTEGVRFHGGFAVRSLWSPVESEVWSAEFSAPEIASLIHRFQEVHRKAANFATLDPVEYRSTVRMSLPPGSWKEDSATDTFGTEGCSLVRTHVLRGRKFELSWVAKIRPARTPEMSPDSMGAIHSRAEQACTFPLVLDGRFRFAPWLAESIGGTWRRIFLGLLVVAVALAVVRRMVRRKRSECEPDDAGN